MGVDLDEGGYWVEFPWVSRLVNGCLKSDYTPTDGEDGKVDGISNDEILRYAPLDKQKKEILICNDMQVLMLLLFPAKIGRGFARKDQAGVAGVLKARHS